VLNGYISAVLGIAELCSIDNDYKTMFDKSIENLKNIGNV